MLCQFFHRKENKNFDPNDVWVVELDLPETVTLAEALDAAHAAGMSKGSQRSGCFEIQTDRGIWSQVNGKKIDPTRPELTPFKTWEELETLDASELIR